MPVTVKEEMTIWNVKKEREREREIYEQKLWVEHFKCEEIPISPRKLMSQLYTRIERDIKGTVTAVII